MYVRGVCAVCYISIIQSYCFQYKRWVVVVVNGISDSYRGQVHILNTLVRISSASISCSIDSLSVRTRRLWLYVVAFRTMSLTPDRCLEDSRDVHGLLDIPGPPPLSEVGRTVSPQRPSYRASATQAARMRSWLLLARVPSAVAAQRRGRRRGR